MIATNRTLKLENDIALPFCYSNFLNKLIFSCKKRAIRIVIINPPP